MLSRDIDMNPGAGRRDLDRLRGRDVRIAAVLQVQGLKHSVGNLWKSEIELTQRGVGQ